MRRIAAILCSAAILVSYPGIAALGQEPEIAIPVGAEVSGSSLYGQDEGWTGGDVQAAEAPADQNQTAVQIAAPSAILMEASTGQVIYEKGADEKRSPASVTKVMTDIDFRCPSVREDSADGRGGHQRSCQIHGRFPGVSGGRRETDRGDID